MKELCSYSNTLTKVFIILLAVSPAFALGEGNRNLLLIGAMGLSPILFFVYPVMIPKIDFPLIILCLLMIFFPLIRYPETMRWSTVLYFCMFCFYFMVFVRILYSSSFTPEDFCKLLRGLLYAYCIVLIIQQCCVLTGLPIFNVSSYDRDSPWKLNSLMSEPSHSARIIPIMMYIYVSIKIKLDPTYNFKRSIKADKWVWYSFLWPVLTMDSATALLFSLIVFSKFFDFRKLIPTLIGLLIIVAVVVSSSEHKSVKRIEKITVAVFTLDEEAIIKADHSASFRIVPTIQGAKKVSYISLDDWFGYGVDAAKWLIKPLPSVKEGNAGAFSMWVNHGLIVAFIIWIVTFGICYMRNLTSILIWFFTIFIVGGLNSQIIWLIIALMTSYKFILRRGINYATPMD